MDPPEAQRRSHTRLPRGFPAPSPLAGLAGAVDLGGGAQLSPTWLLSLGWNCTPGGGLLAVSPPLAPATARMQAAVASSIWARLVAISALTLG